MGVSDAGISCQVSHQASCTWGYHNSVNEVSIPPGVSRDLLVVKWVDSSIIIGKVGMDVKTEENGSVIPYRRATDSSSRDGANLCDSVLYSSPNERHQNSINLLSIKESDGWICADCCVISLIGTVTSNFRLRRFK